MDKKEANETQISWYKLLHVFNKSQFSSADLS